MMGSYRMLLFPALQLCLCLLTSLGAENQEVTRKVQQFVVSHVDVFIAVLKDKTSPAKLQSLEELVLTTAVLSKSVAEDVVDDLGLADGRLESKGDITRIRRQLLALLPRYCSSEKHLQQMRSALNVEGQEGSDDSKNLIQLYVDSIAANIVSFSRAYVSKSGPSLQSYRLLFTPSLTEATAWDTFGKDDLNRSVAGTSHVLGIGQMVLMLKHYTKLFLEVFELHKQYSKKLSTVSDHSTSEIRGFGDSSSTEHKQSLKKENLATIVHSQTEQLQRLSYIIENCLFLVWNHLEYYLLHCVPYDKGTSLYQYSINKPQMRRMQDATESPTVPQSDAVTSSDSFSIRASQQDLDKLRADAPGCINETLFKKLNYIEQYYTNDRTRHSFVQAMIRRIKGLLHLS